MNADDRAMNDAEVSTEAKRIWDQIVGILTPSHQLTEEESTTLAKLAQEICSTDYRVQIEVKSSGKREPETWNKFKPFFEEAERKKLELERHGLKQIPPDEELPPPNEVARPH